MDCRLEELAVVVVGDSGDWLLTGLRRGAVAVTEVEDEGFILTFDNRYYTAEVRVHKFDKVDKLRGFQWGAVVIQAPSVLVFEDFAKSIEALDEELGEANKTLVVNNPTGRTIDAMERWCTDHHFDCVNWTETRVELEELSEKWGAERLLEVLEAHPWPQAVRKLERRTGNADVDYLITLASHLEASWQREGIEDSDPAFPQSDPRGDSWTRRKATRETTESDDDTDEDVDFTTIPKEFEDEILAEFGTFVEARLAQEDHEPKVKPTSAKVDPFKYDFDAAYFAAAEKELSKESENADAKLAGAWVKFEELANEAARRIASSDGQSTSSAVPVNTPTEERRGRTERAGSGADELLRKIQAGEDCGIETAIQQTLKEVTVEDEKVIAARVAMSVYTSWTQGDDDVDAEREGGSLNETNDEKSKPTSKEGPKSEMLGDWNEDQQQTKVQKKKKVD